MARMLALAAAGVIILAVPAQAAVPRLPLAPERAPSADGVLVRLAPGAGPSTLGGRRVAPVPGTPYVRVDGDPSRTLRALRRDPRIAHAEPNRIRRKAAVPDDLLYRFGSDQRLSFELVRAPAAWDVTRGASSARIAVLDTGVDLDHPDLAGRLVAGRDIVNGDAVPDDDDGHGTAVAGLVAAATDDGRGVAGMTWTGGLMPVKVLDENGDGTDADIATGLDWALDNGAGVVLMPFAAAGTSSALSAAIDTAVARGAVVVAASGNSGRDRPLYPAAHPSVVAAGATNRSGDVTWFSSWGDHVDVAAPGYEIGTTRRMPGPVEGYGLGSGTSYAAALVAGAAALVRAHDPSLGPAAVADRLRTAARDAGPPGIDPSYGHGLLDAYAAVGGPPLPPLRAPRGDADEPNHTPDRATAITDPYFESATIAPQHDVDWWSLDVTSPGTIVFEVQSSWYEDKAEGMLPAAQVFGPDLRPVTAPVSGFTVNRVEAPAPTAGRYRLKVWNVHGSRGRLSNGTPWTYTVKREITTTASPAPPPAGTVWIRDTSPADFTQGVAAAASPTVRFGRDLDAASVTAANLRLSDGVTGAAVPAQVGWAAATRTATIDPSADLASGRPYLLTVSGVRDAAGAVMDERFRARFTAGTIADATPPDTLFALELFGSHHTDHGFDFASTEPGSRFECSYDNGAWRTCDTPEYYAMGPDGTRSMRVRAVDAAGNVDATPASRTWTMPPANDGFAAAQSISGASGTLRGSTVGATAEEGEPAHAGGGGRSVWFRWTAPSTGTLDLDTYGSHFATAVALYTGTTLATLVEQGAAPGEDATGWSHMRVPVTAGQQYRIALDGASRTFVGRGSYDLRWALGPPDTTAPDTTISSGPTGAVRTASASFAFTSSEQAATFECALDGGAFAACTSPRSYSALADGPHTFRVRARDASGNVDTSPATRSWTVDTEPPDTNVWGPQSPAASRSATFTFNSPDGGTTFQCALDGGTYASCTSPHTYSALTDGDHEFAVRARDAAGNVDPSAGTWHWTVDATAPDTEITAGPAGTVDEASATFTFTASEPGGFECALDDAPYATCTSPASYANLRSGSHTFAVRAYDEAGNLDATPASRSWTVEPPAAEEPPPPPPGGGAGTPGDAFGAPLLPPAESLTGGEDPSGGNGAPPRLIGAPPRLAGPLRAGRTLRAAVGTWANAERLRIIWMRCDAAGGRCRPVQDGGSQRRLVALDAGRRLRIDVVAQGPAGEATALSALTGVVRARRGRTLIVGTSGDDELIGTRGPDEIRGLAGDDVLTGGMGRDRLVGGPGRDQAVVGPGDRAAGVERVRRVSASRASPARR